MTDKEVTEAFKAMIAKMGVEKAAEVHASFSAMSDEKLDEEFTEADFKAEFGWEQSYAEAEAELEEMYAPVKPLSSLTNYRRKARAALRGQPGLTEQEQLDALEKAQHCVGKAIEALKAKMEDDE